jgi:hypothetical protein
MPFNASGVFQRLFNWRNDRDGGIKILAERMDQETDGIAAAINDMVQGNISLKGRIKNVDGTAASPAYTFADDPDSGLFRKPDASIGVSVGGVEVGSLPASFFTGITAHHAATNNPHAVTAAQVGAYTLAQSDARYSAIDVINPTVALGNIGAAGYTVGGRPAGKSGVRKYTFSMPTDNTWRRVFNDIRNESSEIWITGGDTPINIHVKYLFSIASPLYGVVFLDIQADTRYTVIEGYPGGSVEMRLTPNDNDHYFLEARCISYYATNRTAHYALQLTKPGG